MAQVFRADDTLLKREVAVKLLYPHLLRDPTGKSRFLREARAAAALDHPGILKIFDVDEGEGGAPFIVMELLRGRTLKAFVDQNGPPLGELVALAGAALAGALAVAHAAGVIHRDVKPANVVVAGGGRLVLCDFGVARVIDDDALATQSGLVLGTPAYMSPEQALGRKVDERSDVYSLGATLYQLATGAPPFSGTSSAVIQDVLRGRFTPPLRRNPTMGADLAAIIERAMAREPEARPQTASELGEALEAVASGADLDARRDLPAYFADPGGWNQAAMPRIVAATLAQARTAAASKRTARALALAERVLAFDSSSAEANSLVAHLGVASRRRRQATLLLGGAAALAAVGLASLALLGGGRPAVANADASVAVAVVEGEGERAGEGGRAGAGADAAPAPAPVPAPVPVPDAAPVPAAVAVPAPPPRPRLPRPASHPPDAGIAAVSAPPAPVAPPAPATLEVRVRPWCDITVDGIAHGRSPTAGPISLDPGRHTLRCEQPGLGRSYDLTVDLAPGERRTVDHDLLGEVAVRVDIRDAVVVVDGRTLAAGARLTLTPGRHRVELRRGAALVGAAYVHVSARPCTLRETPELACYED